MFDYDSIFDYQPNREFEYLRVNEDEERRYHFGTNTGGYALQNARSEDLENAIADYRRSNDWN